MKRFWKKRHRCVIIAIIFAFPLVVGWIYSLDYPQVIAVDVGDLLGYYGVAFGIVGSFFEYTEKKKEEKSKEDKEYKPKLFVKVEAKNSGIFTIKLENLSSHILRNIYLYDECVDELLHEGSASYEVCFCQTTEAYWHMKNSEQSLINITVDDNILDEDLHPKYIQIVCETEKGDCWVCEFDRCKNGLKDYYYPNY